MSEENVNNDVAPALLPEGETVLDAEKVDSYKEAVEDIVNEVKDTAVISSPEPVKDAKPAKPALAPVADGVIGSGSVTSSKKKPEAPAKKDDTVAIHSTRNVTWGGVGKVYNGYNVVSKEAAEKWLTRSHVRLVTPEEVAREFGK